MTLSQTRARVALVATLAILATLSLATQALAANAPGRGLLPDDRAYELVSPPSKNGGDVSGDSQRVRAADDGDAVVFQSLAPFADVAGTGVAVDYMAARGGGGNGWVSHSLTPLQRAATPNALLASDPLYVGDFSPDLSKGVFRALEAAHQRQLCRRRSQLLCARGPARCGHGQLSLGLGMSSVCGDGHAACTLAGRVDLALLRRGVIGLWPHSFPGVYRADHRRPGPAGSVYDRSVLVCPSRVLVGRNFRPSRGLGPSGFCGHLRCRGSGVRPGGDVGDRQFADQRRGGLASGERDLQRWRAGVLHRADR